MIKIIMWLLIGYVIGSIPWALIIGKVFYKTDIRTKGSGNLGGTNAGRVLGKKVGLTVIILDALKAFLVMILCNALAPEAIRYAGLAVCIGHCFPLFANFKGGKAVACSMGYILGLGIFVTKDVIFTFVFPLLFFLIVLCLTKYVSLSSMCGLFFAAIMGFLTYRDNSLAMLVLILACFVAFMHRANIMRLIKGTESKVKWIK
ncbi:MAG: glycerol-3-phosphate 1-O-acyltransferase PlsY [Erysipelotrichaceae bacterium]|nr:glycerol-3-phosphate 1-O-acyltransferase PlsY [Erysipelotrichaceae bacterium]